MYLQPWQIFAGGCVVGVIIAIIIVVVVIFRIALKQGVDVSVNRDKKEDKDNG